MVDIQSARVIRQLVQDPKLSLFPLSFGEEASFPSKVLNCLQKH